MMTTQESIPPAPPEPRALRHDPSPPERPPAAFSIGALRAVFYREFQPHVPLTLGLLGIAVVITVLALVVNYLDNPLKARDVTSILNNELLHVLMLAGCPFAGLVLGAAQVKRDAADMWAFMMHRPVSRGLLFAGRLLAGTALYGIAVGVPLAAVLIYSAWPGGRMPFDWRWTLPTIADGMAGMVFYLAGLLMFQREARAVASAWIPLIGAIGCSVAMALVPRFWEALVIIGASLAWYGIAALGSSASQGYRLRSSRKARWATGFVLFVGLSILFVICGVFAEYQIMAAAERAADKLPGVREENLVKSVKRYEVFFDGTLGVRQWEYPAQGMDPRESAQMHEYYERVWPEKGVPDFTGLPENASRTMFPEEIGTPLPSAQPYQNLQFQVEWVIGPETVRERPNTGGGTEASLMSLMPATAPPQPNERWFYVMPPGVWQGYAVGTHAYLGSLGEDGFAPPGRRATPFATGTWQLPGMIMTARGVYTWNLAQRTVKQEWEFPADEKIVFWDYGPRPLASDAQPGAPTAAQANNRLLAVTRDKFLVYSIGNLKPVLAVPLAHNPKTHRISVARSERTHRWVLWYQPRTDRRNEYYEGTIRNHEVEFFDDAGKQLGHVNIAVPLEIVWRDGKEPLRWTPQQASIMRGMVMCVGAVETLGGLPWNLVLGDADWMPNRAPDTHWLLMRIFGGSFWVGSGITLLVTAVAMGLLARRYAVRHSWAWIAGTVIFGPVMLVLLAATHTLPRRVRCGTCGKPHFIAEARCPHCRTLVASPARIGTEVFAQETAAVP